MTATAAFDFDKARSNMVDSQVRPNKVTDARILTAMRRLAREDFLPAGLASRAYSDGDVPLGDGRVMMAPMAIARLVQLAAVREGEAVLVVGAGAGYGAAVLAACGARVFALEENPALAAVAASAFADVSLVSGPLAAGWPAGAPYDLVLIEGAVREIPSAIAAQLHGETGRLVTVHQLAGRVGQAVLAQRTDAGLRMQPAFDCATPLLAPLLPEPGFVF
jgi:protein-L-isoaspartate(D-aspartate) O-methyltransferase